MALEASIRIIYDRRKKASATVKGGVEIEVYYNRQRVRFLTGVNGTTPTRQNYSLHPYL